MRRLGPARDHRAFWQTVGRFALYGPLVGGLPYAWMLFTLPFIYAFGLVPAVVAGMVYATWLHAPGTRPPSAAWRATVGAICGAAGCAATALAAQTALNIAPAASLAVLAPHGVVAALVLALANPAPPAARSMRTLPMIPATA